MATRLTGTYCDPSTLVPTSHIPAAPEAPPPESTADPNSLGELMRYAIFLPGDPFPYDPKTLFKLIDRAAPNHGETYFHHPSLRMR